MSKHNVAVIGGDGIGPEIIAEGVKVLDAAGDAFNFSIDWREYPIGADHYIDTGELVSEETLKELGKAESIYLGALGDPRCEPGVLFVHVDSKPCDIAERVRAIQLTDGFEVLDLRIGQQFIEKQLELIVGQRPVFCPLEDTIDPHHGLAAGAQMEIGNAMLLHDFQECIDTRHESPRPASLDYSRTSFNS